SRRDIHMRGYVGQADLALKKAWCIQEKRQVESRVSVLLFPGGGYGRDDSQGRLLLRRSSEQAGRGREDPGGVARRRREAACFLGFPERPPIPDRLRRGKPGPAEGRGAAGGSQAEPE